MTPSKKWEEGKVLISRKEFGEIIASNVKDVVLTAMAATKDLALCNMLKELLMQYSAAVATQVFKDADDEIEVE